MWYAVAAEAVPRTRSLYTWRLSSSHLLSHSIYLAIDCLPIHLPGDQVMTLAVSISASLEKVPKTPPVSIYSFNFSILGEL
jgi:hypothetical protein